jgi:hypothetical protein
MFYNLSSSIWIPLYYQQGWSVLDVIVFVLMCRYDYLEFTDAKGVKVRYDQKVGTNKWPKQVYFAGPHLHFIFRSDSSNTEWGYKFKVTNNLSFVIVFGASQRKAYYIVIYFY